MMCVCQMNVCDLPDYGTCLCKLLLKPLFLSAFSAPLHPIPALVPLAVEFALEWGDAQFGAIPEAVHLTGEVLGELGEWITSRVSSLAGRGVQLAPGDHCLLSITANLWCSLSPRARRGVPTPVVAVV